MAHNSEGQSIEFPPDGETGYKLKFNDDQGVNITKHYRMLSGFLSDMPEDGTPEPLPVDDFSSKAFELIQQIVELIKNKNPRLYLQYLNQENVKFSLIH